MVIGCLTAEDHGHTASGRRSPLTADGSFHPGKGGEEHFFVNGGQNSIGRK